MKKILVVLLLICCALPVMAKKRQSEEIITPLTQLEKRQYQTRTYNAQDRLLVMKSVLNVLQDEGFIVYNANPLLGFIYGVKDFDLSDDNIDISREFGFTKSRLNYNGVKVATLETSANVTDYGDNIRVRINFKRKLLNQYGNAQFIDDISDAEFYADFYEKLDTAMQLQKTIQGKVKQPSDSVKNEEKVNNTNIEEPKQNEAEVNTKNTGIEEDAVVEEQEPEIQKEENHPAQERLQTEKVLPSEEPNQGDVTEENVPENVSGANVDNTDVQEPEIIPDEAVNSADLKEMIKQAKAEAKQAQKEVKQAQKELQKAQKEAEKEAKREAKRQAKELEE